MAAVLLCLLGAELVSAGPFTPAKPNILFILADDLGYGDLSFQNPKSKIQSPRLDSLASQGMRFESAHAPSGLCTPSRYSLMCGQFCWRSRLKSGVLNSWDEPIIPRDRMTVARMLRDQGYATGCFGKWHLGMSWPFKGTAPAGFDTSVKSSDLNWSRRIAGGPVDYGFDYYFGINIANEPPYAYILNDHVLGVPNTQYATVTGLQSHWGGPGVSGWDWSRVLPDVVSNAVDWLQQKTSQSPARPFFMYLALPGPHQPVVPSAQFAGTSRAGLYGDYVQELDAAVGQVLDALQTSGAATNTLVIFTSDNGPDEFAYDRIQQYHHWSMGPLRGIKNDLWEGGHRVPFLVRWPGQIAAGTSNSQVICHTDLMRTLAELVGARLPANAAEDSMSFLPTLLGSKPPTARSSLILESGRGQFGLWTNQWMFIDSSTGDGHDPEMEPVWFKESRGYALTNSYPALLYDLTRDITERTNLYSQHFALSSELQAGLRNQRGIQVWCGGQSDLWTNSGNWSQNKFPTGCDLVYSNAGSVSLIQRLGTNLSVNSLSLRNISQPLTVQAGGPYSLTIANGIDMELASADLTLDVPVALAQSQTWTVTSNRTLRANGPIALNTSDLMICGHGNMIATNTIYGAGKLIVRGSGYVLLGGKNTYSGGTEVSGGGFLVTRHSQSLGSGGLDIPNNSTLQLDPGVTLKNTVRILGTGRSLNNISCGAVMIYRPGQADIQGPVILTDDAGVSAQAPGGLLSFSAPITGDANFTILPGRGIVVLATNNSYTGNTFVEGHLGLTGGDDRLPATTHLFLAYSTNASLDLGTNHQTVGALAGGGTVTLAGGSITLNQDSAATFAGFTSGNGEVIKTNQGVLNLVGTFSHAGKTRVTGGELQVNGAVRGSSVSVRDGVLSGEGLLTGPVQIETGGVLSPGLMIGTLTMSNTLALTENSTTLIRIDSGRGMTAAVNGLHHVSYGGRLQINDVSGASRLTPGQSFQIFTAATATGQFSEIQPAPGAGLAWSFDPVKGTLAVVARPNLQISQADPSHFMVSWSGAGFRLQVQTNSLSLAPASWFDYAASSGNPMTIPIDPSQPALFFRLVSP